MRVISIWREKGRYFRLVKYPEKRWAELEVVHDGAWCFVEYAPDTVEMGIPQETPPSCLIGKRFCTEGQDPAYVTIINIVELQTDFDNEARACVLYKEERTGRLIAMRSAEFFNGRYQEVVQEEEAP